MTPLILILAHQTHEAPIALAVLGDDAEGESPLRLSLREYAFRLCFLLSMDFS